MKCAKRLVLPKLTLNEMLPHHVPAVRAVPAPTFHPSPEQFQDAIQYIESVRSRSEPYGMCCVIPPQRPKVTRINDQ